MRSGIGAKSELAQHGIECKVDLQGVGKNLMDHLVRLRPNRNKKLVDVPDYHSDCLHFLCNQAAEHNK